MNTGHIICPFLIGVFSVLEANAQWTRIAGPYGGEIECLAVKGSNLFAGTCGEGVFLTTDNGTRWTAVSSGLPPYRIDALAADDSNLFAGTYGGGAFHSTNNGANWTAAGLSSSNSVQAFALAGPNLYAGALGVGNGVFLSTNKGKNWISIHGGDIQALAVSGPNIIAGSESYPGLHLSSDNGTSWTESYYDRYVYDITAVGTSVFAGTEKGVLLSTNNGLSFAQKGMDNFAVSAVAMNGTKLFAAGVDLQQGGWKGVFLSGDSGRSWTPVNAGLTSLIVYDLAVSSTNLFAATGSGGVFLSTNNGTSWTAVNTGLDYAVSVSSLGVNGMNLFAAMYPSCGGHTGVFRLNPSDTYWTAADSGLAGGWVSGFATLGTILFAGGVDGVYRSSDNGERWTRVEDVSGSKVFAAGSNLFVGRDPFYWGPGRTGSGAAPGSLSISKDTGASWSKADSGLAWRSVTSLIEMDNAGLFVGSDSGVFRSTDIGATWTICDTSFSSRRVNALATIGTNLFAATDSGLFLSTNNGTSWNSANNGLPLGASQLAVSGTNLFAGGVGGGVFLSTNHGTSWGAVNSGLTNTAVLSLAVVGTNLVAGTTNGVWRRPLSEMITSVRLPSLESPAQFSLTQNYPNPFNPSTTIEYELPTQSHVSLKVYNLLGQEVAVLLNEVQTAGYKSVEFKASSLPSGVYLYRLQAGEFVATKKFVLLK